MARLLPSDGFFRLSWVLAAAALALAAGCGDSMPAVHDGAVLGEAGTDGGPEAEAPEGGTTDVGDVCSQCAADEICIQLDDSGLACRLPLPHLMCQHISEDCRPQLAHITPTSRSCFSISAECQREFCPSPYQCVDTPACGNESSRAVVWCYGS
jgi:hypothetical protein